MSSKGKLDRMDHVAISVKDIAATVDWYRERFNCDIVYQDETWAMVQFDNITLAFVIPEQHPPHIAFVKDNAAEFGELAGHRDGTASIYIDDVAGNAVEIMAPHGVY